MAKPSGFQIQEKVVVVVEQTVAIQVVVVATLMDSVLRIELRQSMCNQTDLLDTEPLALSGKKFKPAANIFMQASI